MLTYNGNGEHITGIPAQDLSDEDIARIAGDFHLTVDALIEQLTSRGLYSAPKSSRKSKSKSEVKDDGIRTSSIPQDTDQ